MKKLAIISAILLGGLVIGCASSITYTANDGYTAKSFEKKTGLLESKKLNEGTFPWEYQPITVLVTPESRAVEFTAQWVGIDKSVVLKVFGEPARKIPYPSGFTEECWYYLIRNTKWFIFVSTATNKVVDIQYQNPGQPMMTTGARAPQNPALTAPLESVPPGYRPYLSYK